MPKLTRKTYTRKLIAVGGLVFASVALISTGFAAFIISNNAKAEANSNVEIGTISTASLEFDAVSIVDNKSFKFDGALGDNEGRVTTSAGQAENLSITITGKIKNAQYLNKCTAKLTVPAGLQAAVDKKYIVLPECASTEVEVTTGTPSANNIVEFTYTVEFAWGDAFGNINPSLFFDSYEATDANGKVGRDYTQQEVIDTLADFRITMFAIERTDSTQYIEEDYNADAVADNNKYKVTFTAYTN